MCGNVYADEQQEVAKVIAAEACGEGNFGMKLVGEVIRNRVDQWKKTPYQIVSQPNQFFGFTAKNKERLYRECKVMSDSVAKDVMQGSTGNLTSGALYFRQPTEKLKKWHKQLTYRYKNHEFYK